MEKLLHRHQAWLGALALILGLAIAASPTFAPPLDNTDAETRPAMKQSSMERFRYLDDALRTQYVDANIAMRESHIADFRKRSHDPMDSPARREARARLPELERELGELRCLR